MPSPPNIGIGGSMRGRLVDLLVVLILVVLTSAVAGVSQDTAGKGPAAQPSSSGGDDLARVDEKLDAMYNDADAMGDPSGARVRRTLNECLELLARKEAAVSGADRAPIVRARIRVLMGILGNRLLTDDALVARLRSEYLDYALLVPESDDLGDLMDSVRQVICVQGTTEKAIAFLREEGKLRKGILLEYAKYWESDCLVRRLGRSGEAEKTLADLDRSGKSPVVTKKARELLGELRECSVGRGFPDFALTDLQGRATTTSSWRGVETLVIAEAPECGGCAGVPSDLERVRSRVPGDRLRIVLLVVGPDREALTRSLKAVDLEARGFVVVPVVQDFEHPTTEEATDVCVRRLYIRRFPTAWLIGRDGRIVETTLERGGYKPFIAAVEDRFRMK